VLGNWAKTFHPRKIVTNEFVKVFVNKSQGCGSGSKRESARGGVLLFLTKFTDLLMLCEIIAKLELDRRSASRFRTAGIWLVRGTVKMETSENLDNSASAMNSEAHFGDPGD
jgi:hypothetical protein